MISHTTNLSSLHPSIHLSSIHHPSIHPYINFFIIYLLSINPSIHTSSIHYPSIYLSIQLSINPIIHPSFDFFIFCSALSFYPLARSFTQSYIQKNPDICRNTSEHRNESSQINENIHPNKQPKHLYKPK